MRFILLNPGPVSLSEGVRRAATRVDLCHREPEFLELQDRVIQDLLGVYGCDPEQWVAVLTSGSGTSAVEAMVASLLPGDTHLLVLENGVYSERLSRIAGIHGIHHQALRAEWGAPVNLAELDSMLSTGEFTHVAAVHHEATTGRLNPVVDIADTCMNHGIQLLLDTVSSFGAEAIPFDKASLMAVATAGNKCLHGIPGLAIVLCRRQALRQDIEPRSLCLHLPGWSEHQDRQSTPFTPSVNAVMALAQALEELKQQGGWRVRRARYQELATRVANACQALGVTGWLSADDSSCVLRSYHMPDGLSHDELHDGLKQNGFIIYAGQGDLEEKLFRISTMGDISDYDMARLEQALKTVITS